VANMAVIEAVFQSAESGAWVDLSPGESRVS
jgi:hypothetical protein